MWTWCQTLLLAQDVPWPAFTTAMSLWVLESGTDFSRFLCRSTVPLLWHCLFRHAWFVYSSWKWMFKMSLHRHTMEPPMAAALLSKRLLDWCRVPGSSLGLFWPLHSFYLTHSPLLMKPYNSPNNSSLHFVLTSYYKPHWKLISKYLAIAWILLCLRISSDKQIHSSFVNSALL